jgi:hypothetical protein
MIALIIGAVYMLITAVANADEQNQKQVAELVQELGNDSFQIRERAAEDLLSRGLQTKAALFAGMESMDPEIASRCRRLWSEARIDAGWQGVRELIGDSPQARELFDQMFLAAPAFWYELADAPRSADVLFEERLRQVQVQLREKQTSNWDGSLANLLYFGVRIKKETPRKELPRLDDLLSNGRAQQSFAANEPIRRLFDEWTIATRSDGPAFDRLLIALRDRRPQAVEIARELLRNAETPAKERQYALLAMVDSQSLEDGELIAEAFDDSTSLDVLFTRGVVVQSQLRDIALAVEINRNGQNPVDFGFQYLRPNESTTYSPSSLGFRDPAEREAAFEQWSKFTSHQSFQESR